MRSPPGSVGPSSSATASTSTGKDGTTPTSRTDCGNVSLLFGSAVWGTRGRDHVKLGIGRLTLKGGLIVRYNRVKRWLDMCIQVFSNTSINKNN